MFVYILGASGLFDSDAKSKFRIMILGAPKTGKTAIVRQFLYDQFSTVHKETTDDMYRGEFEDWHGRPITFNIQDVGGRYVYDFPSMRSVSFQSADAFILVFSLSEASTWNEAYVLRDMIIEAKVGEITFWQG